MRLVVPVSFTPSQGVQDMKRRADRWDQRALLAFPLILIGWFLACFFPLVGAGVLLATAVGFVCCLAYSRDLCRRYRTVRNAEWMTYVHSQSGGRWQQF